jgi:hypothetical protein
LSSRVSDNPLVVQSLCITSELLQHGHTIVFCWIPGHTGIPGNEAADAAAKSAALHGSLASDRALGSDVSAFLHRAVISSWQDDWTNTQGNKFRAVKPSVQVWTLLVQLRQEG